MSLVDVVSDSLSLHQYDWLSAGTNVTEAKEILRQSGLPISSANDLDDAAKKAVAAIA
jgi:hypothetical protein